MPILAREPDCYPVNLFDSDGRSHAGSAWWVFHALARREKKLLRELRANRLTCCCPQIVRRRGGHRLVIAVNFLQRGVSALLEDTDVAAS